MCTSWTLTTTRLGYRRTTTLAWGQGCWPLGSVRWRVMAVVKRWVPEVRDDKQAVGPMGRSFVPKQARRGCGPAARKATLLTVIPEPRGARRTPHARRYFASTSASAASRTSVSSALPVVIRT